MVPLLPQEKAFGGSKPPPYRLANASHRYDFVGYSPLDVPLMRKAHITFANANISRNSQGFPYHGGTSLCHIVGDGALDVPFMRKAHITFAKQTYHEIRKDFHITPARAYHACRASISRIPQGIPYHARRAYHVCERKHITNPTRDSISRP